MDELNDLKDKTIETFSDMFNGLGNMLLKVVIAIVIILVGILITKLIVGIIKKVLKLAKADKLDDKLNEIELFGDKKLNFDIVKIVSTFVKWILYVFLLIIVSEYLNLTIVTQEVGKLLNYLPQLLTALIIVVFGLLLANAIKKAIKSFFDSVELSGGKFVSQLVFTIILVFVSITALNQAGVNTDIITNNITMVFGGFLIAFALAFGIGARNIVEKMLKAYHARRVFEIGQKIKINNIEGEIEALNPTTVVLNTSKGKLILPIEELSDNQIEIHE